MDEMDCLRDFLEPTRYDNEGEPCLFFLCKKHSSNGQTEELAINIFDETAVYGWWPTIAKVKASIAPYCQKCEEREKTHHNSCI